MAQLINGLHHVTALASNPQRNIDFYVSVLGLRMVKKTINFDAPDVYHLYYGDEIGNPGTIMTFFPYPGLVRGRVGKGQTSVTAFSIPDTAVGFWQERLKRLNIPFTTPQERLDEVVIALQDFDGLPLELVANAQDTRPGWTDGRIPAEYAVRGFYSVGISIDSFERSAALLTETMQHRLVAQRSNLYRFEAGAGGAGNYIDIYHEPEKVRGLQGSGTIHHIAFGTNTDQTQLEIREHVAMKGFQVTPVLDRQYFHSIYFREPGGVLFEVATNPPGFTYDEAVESLGTALKLPPWQERNRAEIEAGLQPVHLPDNYA